MELIKEDYLVFANAVYRHRLLKPEGTTEATKEQKNPTILPNIGVYPFPTAHDGMLRV